MHTNLISPPATVFVVDDDSAVGRSVVALVREMGVGARSFSSAEQFLEAYEDGPGCLVTDVRMMGMSGVELQEKLVEDGIVIPVIVITAYADIPLTVRAMRNGAFTVLEKPFRELELWDAIRKSLSSDEANRDRQRRRLELQRRLARLTREERQVVDLLVLGKPNKVIAGDLNLSLRSIEARRHHVFRKMHVRSVAELVGSVFEAETGATLNQRGRAG